MPLYFAFLTGWLALAGAASPGPSDAGAPANDAGAMAVPRAARKASPEQSTSAASAPRGAPLTQEEIREVVLANYGDVQECYFQVLRLRPKLRGTLTLQFAVNADGSVGATEQLAREGALDDAFLSDCLVQRLRRWRFPARPAPSRVIQPFVFHNWSGPDGR